jgi:hypothetical protein
MAKAIFFQKSKSVQIEFNLIEMATEREEVVEQLEKIIRDVKVNCSTMSVCLFNYADE